MNGNAHKAIAEAAKKLVNPDLFNYLNEKIDCNKWEKVRKDLQIPKDEDGISENSTYWDLFVLGAKEEDNCAYISDVEDPDHKKCAFGRLMGIKGEHQHWLEHFWNNDMGDDHDSVSKKCGFKFTHEYICGIVGELIGTDYFLRNGSFLISHTSDAVLKETLAQIIEFGVWAWHIKNGGDPKDPNALFGDGYYSAPHRAQLYWDKLKDQYKAGDKERAIFNLGKVCHLLADVGTPAHMHGDGHWGDRDFGLASQILSFLQLQVLSMQSQQNGLDDDEYEEYTSKIIKNNNGNLPSSWDVNNYYAPIYRKNWELFNYFKELGEYTRRFDSDDCDGSATSKPYHWAHFEYLNSSTWGIQRQTNDDLTEYACNAIAQDLIPLTICYTAGVLHLFAKEMVDLPISELEEYDVTLNKLEIHDDTDPFAAGELYFDFKVNKGQKKFLSKITANSGDVIDLSKQGNNRGKERRTVPVSLQQNKNSILVETHGEDNDDWWLFGWHEKTESLGFTKRIIYKKEIDHEHNNEYKDISDNKKYTVHYSINYKGGKKKSKKISHADIDSKKLYEIKKTKYKEGNNLSMQPLTLNMDTMHMHLHSLKNKPCGIGENSKGRKVTFYQYDDELFKSKGMDAKECTKRINKILDLGENYLQDSKIKNQLQSVPSLREINETELREQIKQIREGINNKEFQIKLQDFCKKNNTEYQIVTNQIMKPDTEETISNVETPKWECKNEKEFYESFSTECQCCKDKKTKPALEKRIRFIKESFRDK